MEHSDIFRIYVSLLYKEILFVKWSIMKNFTFFFLNIYLALHILGLILVSIRRFADLICYQGDVFGFLNQSETTISANLKNKAQRAYRGLAAAFSAPQTSFAYAA